MKHIPRSPIMPKVLILALASALPQCKPRERADATLKGAPQVAASDGASQADQLPLLLRSSSDLKKIEAAVRQTIAKARAYRGLPQPVVDAMAPKIAHYLGFLGLMPNASDKTFDKILNRILESSTQFLVCPDLMDWSCLQADPVLPPKAEYRQATEPGLGQPIRAGKALDMDIFFTQQFNKPANWKPGDRTMALDLAKIISNPRNRKISMAAYGIRSIHEGESMFPVFDAIATQKEKGTEIRAVVDQVGQEKPNEGVSVIFTYLDPMADKKMKLEEGEVWAFSKPDPDQLMPKVTGEESEEVDDEKEEMPEVEQWIEYTYANTPDLLALLNEGITSDDEAKARLEWPSLGIMHNKFLVFEDGKGPQSVWTGTTNLSDTCMGEERNSNLGVLIKNVAVAQTYLDEFNEMFEFQAGVAVIDGEGEEEPGMGLRAPRSKSIANEFAAGKFHHNKRPNTKRYFKFEDGTELTVHFSPTDDAEHRSILPVLLSARAGDTIRISMFGNSGMEYVRAIQFAVSQGANVKVLVDTEQGGGSFSWLGKKSPASLQDKNPYTPAARPGTFELKKGGKGSDRNWQGKNHHKSATLTRADGTVEIFLTGSQNWSVGGNDKNDENMVSIRNPAGIRSNGKDVGKVFNAEFDNNMWRSAKAVR